MFSLDEVEALALGARWVEGRADQGLAKAARSALAKIAAVLPPERAEALDWPTMLAGAGRTTETEAASLPLIREALSAGRKIELDYVDKGGCPSRRVVWPVALGFFDHARMLAAWCETREAFRHFRLDRIAAAAVLEERPPKGRRTLLVDWRRAEGLDE